MDRVLDKQRSTNPGLTERIVETICAIANIGPESSGALFIGVADKQSDVERIVELDQIAPLQVGVRFVVGVDRELSHIGLSLEDYKNRLVQQINTSSLSEPLKRDILSLIDCIDYRGLSVICVWIPKQKTLSLLNDKVFYRDGSSTKEATGFTEANAIYSRF